MPRLMLPLVACGLLAVAAQANAQDVCKPQQLKDPKLSLAEMYAKADAAVKAWRPDAVPANLTNTSMGPLDEQGRSEAWSMMFYSKQADQKMSITTFRGTFNCAAMPGAAGRIPDLKPDFFRDGAKLYGLAKQHGAALLSQGYIVMLGTSASPRDRHAMWYINFSKPDGGSGNVTVIVDANTGALEKVIK